MISFSFRFEKFSFFPFFRSDKTKLILAKKIKLQKYQNLLFSIQMNELRDVSSDQEEADTKIVSLCKILRISAFFRQEKIKGF